MTKMQIKMLVHKNNKFKVIDYGAITTPSTMNDIKRLEKIYKGIYILIKNYNLHLNQKVQDILQIQY